MRRRRSTTATTPTQALDEAQSWQFLTEHRIGRLAIVIGGEPDIFPVNYVVDGRSIVFRTAEGSKMLARRAGRPDAPSRSTSGTARGRGQRAGARAAREPTRADQSVEQLPLTPWVATLKAHWVRLDVDEIAGRAFAFGPEPEDFHPLG